MSFLRTTSLYLSLFHSLPIWKKILKNGLKIGRNQEKNPKLSEFSILLTKKNSNIRVINDTITTRWRRPMVVDRVWVCFKHQNSHQGCQKWEEVSPQQPGGSTKILKQSVSDQNASRFQRTTGACFIERRLDNRWLVI